MRGAKLCIDPNVETCSGTLCSKYEGSEPRAWPTLDCKRNREEGNGMDVTSLAFTPSFQITPHGEEPDPRFCSRGPSR